MPVSPQMTQFFRSFGFLGVQVLRIVNEALQTGAITVPPRPTTTTFYAGGTNLCPNSDFAFSHLAATVANTDPANAAAANQRVYRTYFQRNDDTISTNLVEAVPANPEHPIWDKVQGIIGLGSTGTEYDIAIQFTNNWLVGNRKWYVRVAVALDGTDALPVGTRLYAGFWVKRAASEGWASGGNFTIAHEVQGTPGAVTYEYKVIAKTDTGRELESAVLSATDIPATLGGLSTDNKVLISYPGALGFIEFLVYRRAVSTGRVDLIAWDRNSSKLFAYDTGQSLRFEPAGFPSAAAADYRAYEDIAIDAVDIAVGKTFHDFVIRIPANLDTSDIIREGTYLRIGVIGNTANNGQVLVDTIWAAETYNVWSPCPFDAYPSRPSTTMTTSYPGGGPVEDPPTTGGTCVWDQHDLALEDGWIKLQDAQRGTVVSNGSGTNTIREFIEGRVSQYFKVTFDCGLVICCTTLHRFLRSLEDNSGIMVKSLKVGDEIQGAFADSLKAFKVSSIELCNGQINVRTPIMTMQSQNRFFAVGDRTTGFKVFCHNAKQIP